MRPRYSLSQVLGWIAEAETIVEEAESLVVAEGGSASSLYLLGVAHTLHGAAIAKLAALAAARAGAPS